MDEMKNFRQCLGKFATGVTIVTCADKGGKPYSDSRHLCQTHHTEILGNGSVILETLPGDQAPREREETGGITGFRGVYKNVTLCNAPKRINKIVLSAIVTTTVFGTALWGYGYLIFK